MLLCAPKWWVPNHTSSLQRTEADIEFPLNRLEYYYDQTIKKFVHSYIAITDLTFGDFLDQFYDLICIVMSPKL